MLKKRQRFNIGKLSELTGLTIQSIRFYENMNLLPEPSRSKSQYRLYDEDYLEHVNFIKNCQELGFTLEEIKDLVSVKFQDCALGKDVKLLIQKKIEKINCQLEQLKAQKKFLEKLDGNCHGKMPVDDCPILNTLKKEPKHCCP